MAERFAPDFSEYEYRLPLSDVPPEADGQWRDWLAACVGRDENSFRELVQLRFRGASAELSPLGNLVMDFTPFAMVVYAGTPLLWLENTKKEETIKEERDLIYLPPEASYQEVRAALEPFQLDSHQLLVEFLALFGGMGDRWPSAEIEIAGRRVRGKIELAPATVAIEAGLEFLSDAEIRELRRLYARWLGGVELMNGGDGQYWHIGTDGSICEHTCGDPEVTGVFDTLPEMIDSFVKSSRDGDCLFEGAYEGLSEEEDEK